MQKLKTKLSYILIHIVLLCMCSLFVSAQITPGQIRKDILNAQNPVQKKKSKTEKKPAKASKIISAPKPLAPIVNPLNNRNATLVYLENTETLAYDQFTNPDLKILKGNVRFKHDNAYLYCDSAYFYEKANSLDAFSNVRIVQGDTLFIYGDFLYYDGNLKLARLRKNAKMINRKTTLTTDSLNFDRNTNLAYYYTGGKIVDPENTLTSTWGQYNTQTSDAVFRNNVLLTNKNYVMNSDTLAYNTKSYHANIIGPTKIVYQNETDIFSKKGWYNTNSEQMMLLNRSLVVHKDGKTLVGDTIFYDKAKKVAEAFSNVILNDTVQKSTLTGNYVYYNELTENGLATDSALLVDWSSQDTLWVHADTLQTFKDSIFDVAKGYKNVRLYRNDIQGICDSLLFSARDSIINLHGEPVLWAENNQLSGEIIKAYTKNKKVEKVQINNAAMAVQKEDSLYFNQLSGKEIIAYIDSGAVNKVHVNGNAETIYYPKDESDSTLIGINKTESSYVVMYIKNKKADRIVMTSSSNGIMYPLEELKGGDLYLKNFIWIETERPLNSLDVHRFIPKKAREKIGTSTLGGSSSGTSDGNNKPNSKAKGNKVNPGKQNMD